MKRRKLTKAKIILRQSGDLYAWKKSPDNHGYFGLPCKNKRQKSAQNSLSLFNMSTAQNTEKRIGTACNK